MHRVLSIRPATTHPTISHPSGEAKLLYPELDLNPGVEAGYGTSSSLHSCAHTLPTEHVLKYGHRDYSHDVRRRHRHSQMGVKTRRRTWEWESVWQREEGQGEKLERIFDDGNGKVFGTGGAGVYIAGATLSRFSLVSVSRPNSKQKNVRGECYPPYLAHRHP
jgi:hypothetical protein